MTIEIARPPGVDPALKLRGLSGHSLTISLTPDADEEIEFSIHLPRCDIEATAYLGPEERRALIDWLEALK